MVISEKWKSYISDLSLLKNGNIIPIAVDEFAFKIGSNINIKNFIRMKDYNELIKEKVFLAIAHEIYRYGLNENFKKLDIGTKSALKIFISHAKDKENGIYVATEIKKYIDNSVMQSFFDATDIAPGYRFDDEIIENIKQSSVLAINSDIYSSRYWCQRENSGKKIDYNEIVNLIKGADLKNGLSADENKVLFNTVFIDEAVVLILKGIQNIFS